MADPNSISRFLEDRPDLEPAVETVLEHDDPWEFDEVDIDSGELGELVSHGLVESVEGGYRVADEGAVRTVLERSGDAGDPSTRGDRSSLQLSLPSVRWSKVAAVIGVLTLVVLFRVTSAPTVFRGETIVLTGNDPYYYRYVVEQLVSPSGDVTTSLPGGVANGEPLFVVTLRFVAELAGGTPEAVGTVMAWYPVASASLIGVLVYLIATSLSEDRRVALTAVVLLAITPGHAFRTSLGFADHHAFDYLWLVGTVLAVTLVAVETSRDSGVDWRRVTVGVLLLAVSVTGQILAWAAGPLLLLPLAVYAALDSLFATYTDRSPVLSGGPIILGVGLAGVLTWTAHTTLGWHTDLVASVPLLLLAGVTAVVTFNELGYRLGSPPKGILAANVAGAVAVPWFVAEFYPDRWNRVTTAVADKLFRTDAIAETGGLFGESFGWLLLFGFVFVLAVPYLSIVSRHVLELPAWRPILVYALSFLSLSVLQIRFVGQTAPFVAVFAALGTVHLAEWVDIVDTPPKPTRDGPPVTESLSLPSRSTTRSLVLLFLLVGSLSFLQVPIKTSQLTYSDSQYETTMWMADYAEEQRWSYPDSYVFSEWGTNRFYNYFVSGESRSYFFAEKWYVRFLTSTDSSRWYRETRDQVGFILVSAAGVGNETTMGTRLYRADGSRTASAPGTAHYRLVYVADGPYKVFTFVPGATIRGRGPANETITVRTEIDVGSYSSTYERVVETGPNGNYSVTVPYASEYRLLNHSVRVTETDVENGANVTVG